MTISPSFIFVVALSICVANCDRKVVSNKEPKESPTPKIHAAFQDAFKKDGFTDEQIAEIQLAYYKDGIDTGKWPFTNLAKELLESAHNPANPRQESVKEALRRCGGNPEDPSTVSHDVAVKTLTLLDNPDVDADSLLEESASADPVLYNIAQLAAGNAGEISYLKDGISMACGSVAKNKDAISALSGVVTTHADKIATLSTQVSAMSPVTSPTVQLAGALGMPVSSVSQMALAGSFVGPLLGVVALTYAAWPAEESDPWSKVESRVGRMISEKFDAMRRKRLADRLKRYVKQFSLCSQTWVSQGLVNFHGLSLPRYLVDEAKMLKGQQTVEFKMTHNKAKQPYPAPNCTAQLNNHMSLERDEWFRTDAGQMSGLFMPFANMHVQLLSLLSDHPYENQDMKWNDHLKTTSAEYGDYMLTHLLSAWKAQVCRTMRLRQTSGVLSSTTYKFVVLKAVVQPNAAAACEDQCGGKSGWCNYCGGKGEGACCQAGNANATSGDICRKLDVPLTWRGGKYWACVQTDCLQKNTGYYGKEVLKKHNWPENGAPPEHNAQHCQSVCHAEQGAVAFTSNNNGLTCTCLGAKGLQRHQEEGAYSGPTKCKDFTAAETLKDVEEAFEKNLADKTKVPMEEQEVCTKSPGVADFAAAEKEHPEWVKKCYREAAEVVTIEYNTFYKKFARFVDMLAGKAGCRAQHEVPWVESAKDNGFEVVSSSFDGGSFADCNWKQQEQLDKDMWVFDETRSRGWISTSKVDMEAQARAKIQYPMPAWLRDLRNVEGCLKTVAAGDVTNPKSGVASAVSNLMLPASMSAEKVQEKQTPDDEYASMLAGIRGA